MGKDSFKDVLRRHSVPVDADMPAPAPSAPQPAAAPVPSNANLASPLPPPERILETATHAVPPSAMREEETAGTSPDAHTLGDENIRISAEAVKAGLVTLAQCEKIEKEVRALKTAGERALFEEEAVQMGFCSRVQMAELQQELRNKALLKDRYVPSPRLYARSREVHANNLMGSRMIAAGLITAGQRDKIMERQHKLAQQGAEIRFGELAVQLNFCSEDALNALMDDIKSREQNNKSW